MQSRLLLRAGLLGLLTACSSVNPYLENRLVLEQAITQLDAGQYNRTAQTLEEWLADTARERREFALQRFFAAYLLTRTHEVAGARAPYLQEPVPRTGQFDLSSDRSGGLRPSRIGHLLAMTYHSSQGRSWYELTGGSPLEQEGEPLLPAELEELGPQFAAAYMNLCFLAVHSELNFQDRIEEVLGGMDQLTDLAACESLMERVDFPSALRPWVYRGVFEHQKRRDEPNAYRFAIRARETAAEADSFTDELCAEMARWITEESSYRFVSPANQPFDPALEGCTVTGTPNLMYEAILR